VLKRQAFLAFGCYLVNACGDSANADLGCLFLLLTSWFARWVFGVDGVLGHGFRFFFVEE